MPAVFAALAVLQALQASDHGTASSRSAPVPASAQATRAERPPVIDGHADDEVWRAAAPITDFVEFDPVEGKPARFRTEAKVAYDHRNFYVFVRMFDPDPSKVLRILARRDVRAPTDQIKVIIDSYHDRRSGYEFAVNPAGVKRDYAIYNDMQEDEAWDGVWDVATTVDSLGWTAEFRIPLSQLRYSKAPNHTFGFGIWRDIERYKERVSWPLYRQNQNGLSSQLGEVGGITGLSSPRRLELRPYGVTRNVTIPETNGYSHPQRFDGGLDFKYGVSSNVTLDGTINPDFGQIEADPAVLNLTAFETFFQERRPFFIEGAGLLSFPVNCYIVRDCGNENVFYSRRIGRAPQLSGLYGEAGSPAGTTILGATKLTGRMPGGLSLGLLDAVTGREQGSQDRTLEPVTNYTVFRGTQDLRGGETGIGVIGTLVERSLDQWSRDYLRASAAVGGVDLRHRFSRGRYQFNASVMGSRVGGNAAAIAATQQSSAHYYQRPDAELDYDPARTSLSGHAEQLRFAKFGGGIVRFETSYQRISPGFEANDLGFLRRADWQSQATWGSLQFNRPGPFFRHLYWNANEELQWTIAGLPLDRWVNTNVHVNLPNNWWLHLGGSLGGLGTVYCDRCARGGPALRTDRYFSPWAGLQGDSRWVVVPGIWFNGWWGDDGRSYAIGVSPSLDFRVSSRFTASLGLNLSKNRNDRQWFGNPVDAAAVTHYTFAHLEQRTTSLQARINFTATPNLTVQAYAEPFVSKGAYSNVRELADPRAASYDARFLPYAAAGEPGGFNFKQFRSNLVLRWEYRPGSALYLVWQQGRQDSESERGTRSLFRDLDRLFSAHPDNTFLIKLSYWLDR